MPPARSWPLPRVRHDVRRRGGLAGPTGPQSPNASAVTASTCLEEPFASLQPATPEQVPASMAQRFAAMLRDGTNLVRDLA